MALETPRLTVHTGQSAAFSTSRANKWVLTSALLTAIVYLVRHLVEGETSPAPATNTARQFLGQGSPPSFGQWAIAYGTGYTMLALLATAEPELAAGLAMFGLAVVFLESGGQLATDLQGLEHGTVGPGNAAVQGVTGAVSAAGAAGGVGVSGALAPSPQSVGASVKKQTGKLGTPPDTLAKAVAAQGLHYDPTTNQYVP